jgi:sulfite oxidase
MTHLSRRRILASTLAIAGSTLAARSFGWADEAAGKLKVRSKSPLNAEPDLAELVRERITPVELFYVRNHGPIPEVKAEDYRLRIEGLVERPRTYSLAELREKFEARSAEATLTCAGNRRDEMSAVKPIAGVQWNAGAIGHAQWRGPALADLLKAAGVQEGAKHIWLEGLDPIKEKDGSEAPFGGSIPLEKALQMKTGASLLAVEMNGQPLTPEHGFPLRLVVPGYIGARSVKWLSKIVVSDRPSPNHYLADAYKIITSDDKAELKQAKPIYEFPVNAAICTPASGAKLKAGKTTVTGYALPSGDDAEIAKVELSTDGGAHWTKATIDKSKSGLMNWQRWECELDLTPAVRTLTVRATDSRGNSQPKTTPWNVKGYLQNAWHLVAVEVAR